LGSAIAVVAGGTGALELVSHNVLPGKYELERMDGACAVASPPLRFDRAGVEHSGTFYSRARHRRVRYDLAYPPGHRRGSPLPLVVVLHAYGATSANALSNLTLGQACALRINGRALPPMALVAADGGNGYWHAHPGDDPMAMVVDELIPMCQSQGLGMHPHGIGVLGISMGGYGAVLFGETHPQLFSAVAAISPAIWTTYAQAHAANPGAYTSAADFAGNDAVAHASSLTGLPVRVAAGNDDPFLPGVKAFVKALPPGATIDLSGGCHTGPFFTSQEPPSLAFLGQHLARS
jgi:enterochelin esterase-like enzyme